MEEAGFALDALAGLARDWEANQCIRLRFRDSGSILKWPNGNLSASMILSFELVS